MILQVSLYEICNFSFMEIVRNAMYYCNNLYTRKTPVKSQLKKFFSLNTDNYRTF